MKELSVGPFCLFSLKGFIFGPTNLLLARGLKGFIFSFALCFW